MSIMQFAIGNVDDQLSIERHRHLSSLQETAAYLFTLEVSCAVQGDPVGSTDAGSSKRAYSKEALAVLALAQKNLINRNLVTCDLSVR